MLRLRQVNFYYPDNDKISELSEDIKPTILFCKYIIIRPIKCNK